MCAAPNLVRDALIALGSDKLRDTFLCKVLRIGNSRCSAKDRMNMDTSMTFTPFPLHTRVRKYLKNGDGKNVRVRF